MQNTREYAASRLAPAEAARAVSRASALLDELSGALAARVPPELVRRCEAIVARGGPAPPPASLAAIADSSARHARAGAYSEPLPARGQAGAASRPPLPPAVAPHDAAGSKRGSGRLRGDGVDARMAHVNPEQAMRQARRARGEAADMAAADVASDGAGPSGSLQPEVQAVAAGGASVDGMATTEGAAAAPQLAPPQAMVAAADSTAAAAAAAALAAVEAPALAAPPPLPDPRDKDRALRLLARLVACTENWRLAQLEGYYAQLARLLARRAQDADRALALAEVDEFVAGLERSG